MIEHMRIEQVRLAAAPPMSSSRPDYVLHPLQIH